jgi:hypothetical protein
VAFGFAFVAFGTVPEDVDDDVEEEAEDKVDAVAAFGGDAPAILISDSSCATEPVDATDVGDVVGTPDDDDDDDDDKDEDEDDEKEDEDDAAAAAAAAAADSAIDAGVAAVTFRKYSVNTNGCNAIACSFHGPSSRSTKLPIVSINGIMKSGNVQPTHNIMDNTHQIRRVTEVQHNAPRKWIAQAVTVSYRNVFRFLAVHMIAFSVPPVVVANTVRAVPFALSDRHHPKVGECSVALSSARAARILLLLVSTSACHDVRPRIHCRQLPPLQRPVAVPIHTQ